jgi:hypothetical protein
MFQALNDGRTEFVPPLGTLTGTLCFAAVTNARNRDTGGPAAVITRSEKPKTPRKRKHNSVGRLLLLRC